MKDKTQKQKILFISQNFWPENFRSTDVVNNLVNSGYHVEVLTSNPNYPEGKFTKIILGIILKPKYTKINFSSQSSNNSQR